MSGLCGKRRSSESNTTPGKLTDPDPILINSEPRFVISIIAPHPV
jgi:hypothetical protein